MKILGIDSSGRTASVALTDETCLLAAVSVNGKLTHSETLLPMIDEILKRTETQPAEIDAVAVAAGPGSFTGLRIGAATAKGLTLAFEKPVIPVKTLEGMAFNCYGAADVIVPLIDARRHQVYTGRYRCSDGRLRVLEDQKACSLQELMENLNEAGDPVVLLGDGADAFHSELEEGLKIPFRFAPPSQNRQQAASVAALGAIYFREGKYVSSDDFVPVYLRKSQAERMKAEKAGV